MKSNHSRPIYLNVHVVLSYVDSPKMKMKMKMKRLKKAFIFEKVFGTARHTNLSSATSVMLTIVC
jgi:hypothetical protein